MSYSNFEDIIKQKIEGFEFDYDPNEWVKLEKKLPKKPFWSLKNIIFSSVIIAMVSVSIFVLINEQKNVAVKNIANTSNSLPNTRGVNSSTNITSNNSKSKDLGLMTELQKNAFNSNTYSAFQNDTTQGFLPNLRKEKATQEIPFNEKGMVKDTPTSFGSENKSLPEATFTLSAITGCAPCIIKFTPDLSYKSYKYHWDFGDGTSSDEMMPKHTYSEKGLYIANLMITDNGGNTGEYSSNAIVIKSRPEANFEITNENQNYLFTNTSTNSTQWKWNINNTIETSKDLSKSFIKSGNYTINLIAINEEGCRDSISKKIEVTIEYKFYMPTAFTPDGDGNNDLFGPEGDGINGLEYHLSVYDKNGLLVFQTNDPSLKWNGINQHTNKLASNSTDVFVWKIITKDNNGNQQIQSGHVTMIVN